MSWKQLLAQRKIKRHTTSKQELDDLRTLIERSEGVHLICGGVDRFKKSFACEEFTQLDRNMRLDRSHA